MRRCGVWVACLAACLLVSTARANFLNVGDAVAGNSWSVTLTSSSGLTFEAFHVFTNSGTDPEIHSIPGGLGPESTLFENAFGGAIADRHHEVQTAAPWMDSTLTLTFHDGETSVPESFTIWGLVSGTGSEITLGQGTFLTGQWYGTTFHKDAFGNITTYDHYFHPGDFAPVPLPAPVAMAGLGLLGVMGGARRRRTRV